MYAKKTKILDEINKEMAKVGGHVSESTILKVDFSKYGGNTGGDVKTGVNTKTGGDVKTTTLDIEKLRQLGGEFKAIYGAQEKDIQNINNAFIDESTKLFAELGAGSCVLCKDGGCSCIHGGSQSDMLSKLYGGCKSCINITKEMKDEVFVKEIFGGMEISTDPDKFMTKFAGLLEKSIKQDDEIFSNYFNSTAAEYYGGDDDIKIYGGVIHTIPDPVYQALDPEKDGIIIAKQKAREYIRSIPFARQLNAMRELQSKIYQKGYNYVLSSTGGTRDDLIHVPGMYELLYLTSNDYLDDIKKDISRGKIPNLIGNAVLLKMYQNAPAHIRRRIHQLVKQYVGGNTGKKDKKEILSKVRNLYNEYIFTLIQTTPPNIPVFTTGTYPDGTERSLPLTGYEETIYKAAVKEAKKKFKDLEGMSNIVKGDLSVIQLEAKPKK